jgi:hypothetical protein
MILAEVYLTFLPLPLPLGALLPLPLRGGGGGEVCKCLKLSRSPDLPMPYLPNYYNLEVEVEVKFEVGAYQRQELVA